MKQLLLILLSALFVASCSSGNADKLSVVNVFDKSTSGNTATVSLDDIGVSVEKINISEVPGNVRFLLETPEHYFMIFSGGIVNQYDKSGNFVQKIGNNGRGPGEYLNPRSLAFLPDSLLCIFDYNSQAIMEYNTNGEHISTLSLLDENFDPTFVLDKFVANDNKLLLFTSSNCSNIEHSEYNPKNDEYRKVSMANRVMGEEGLMGGVYTLGKNPQYLYKGFNDTLFVLNNNEMAGKLLLKYDDLRLQFSELHYETIGSVISSRLIFNWMNVLGDYLLMSYTIEKKNYLALYNFKTEEYLQSVKITSNDPAAVIDTEVETLYTGANNNELIKVYYPENEAGLQLIKYRIK